MHYCRSEDDVDRKSEEFCRYCGILLGDALRKG
jgi:predicted Zn-dependent protease